MSYKGNTIIISGNLPIHSKDGDLGYYAPSCSSVAASMLYGVSEEMRENTIIIGIANPEGMPSYKNIQPSEFRFLPVETSKRPKDLIFSQHLSQACHHALGNSALFPQDLEEPYNDYLQFNQEFLCSLKTVYSSKDTIIILGKHLLMLPSLIRKEFPMAKISLVFLCPFPPYELFSCIPYSKEVLLSLLACDKLELQNSDYLENFISTAFLSINAQNKEVSEQMLESIRGNPSLVFVSKPDTICKGENKELLLPCAEDGRDMLSLLTTSYKTNVHRVDQRSLQGPVSINDTECTETSEYLEDVMPVVQRLHKSSKGSKTYIVYAENSRVLVSVTPKTVPKEFIKKVMELEECTAVYAKIAEVKKDRKLVLILETTRKIGTPVHNLLSVLKYLKKNPDTNVDFVRCVVYGESVAYHNTELSGLAERITSLYPSRFSTIIFPQLYLYFSLLSLADVCVAGSPTDSMSLAANEYLELNPKGRLIVPYSSGISFEHALYTLNCPDITANVIAQALEKEGEAEVLESTQNWISSLQCTLKTDLSYDVEKTDKIPVHICKDILQEKEEIKKAYISSEQRMIFLDYDGTLTDIVPNPRDAKPTEEILGMLQRLQEDEKNTVFIVTGRGKEEAEEWFGHLGIKIYAEHGTYKKENGAWSEVPCDLSWKPDAIKIIEEYVSYTPGSHIEIKNTCVVFHCKEYGKWCASALQRMVGSRARVVTGKNIIEVRPKGIDKGSCIEKESHYNCFTLCAGDDATDEDMFMVLLEAPTTYTVCVGNRSTSASFRTQCPKDLRELLKYLYE
ncbi:trehalose 6-phosphate synthase/phosphatase [Nematocida minor]|uniref:trehalose 6-phosphate synthase/phosphatase n=1 Tax=Nematocida minor TaxID=1912983 RepID=UPI00221F698F|nr:trehalose 6-phosphate synthase/phosphatase [Nematocida minor]KAI5191778.1 trehalose 6-phosphate synthase/phosphatase [Nematocida minor]